eukprot:289595_1
MSKAKGDTLEPLKKGNNGCPKKRSDLWCIDSKLYDLRGWYGCHPGGADILKKCCGLEDLTPMFESYHAFGSMSSIRKQMSKFEYVGCVLEEDDGVGKTKSASPPPMKYSFHPDGLYSELKREVRGYFMAREGRSLSDNGSVTSGTKATILWYLKVAVLLLVFVLLYCGMLGTLFDEEKLWLRAIMGLVAGMTVQSINFCVLHDASHYGVLLNHKANEIVSRVMCSWSLWNHCMWTKHHVYGHHSFTGDPCRDPDLIHARPFIRKSMLSSVTEYFPYFLKWQHYVAPFFIMVFPGQSTGQTFSYYNGARQGHIWRIPCPGVAEDIQWYEWLIYACSVGSHMYGGSWLCSIVYFMGINIVYFLGIFADHDTYEIAFENALLPPTLDVKDSGDDAKLKDPGHYDWGEIQVRHSGNFVTSSTVFTQLFGGINYQIEHHLFPSISHMHLPATSDIVKRICASRGVPYSSQSTLWVAYNSYIKLLYSIRGNVPCP